MNVYELLCPCGHDLRIVNILLIKFFVSVFCLFTDVDVSYLLIKNRNTSIELITYDYRPTYKSKQGYV